MFDRVQAHVQAGPLKDIQSRDLSQSHTCVVLAMCFGSLSCWKVNRRPRMRSWALRSGAGFHQGSLFTLLRSSFPISWLASQSLPLKNIPTTWCCHQHASCRDSARFPPDVTLGIQTKEFDLGFIRPNNLVSHVQRCLLANSKRAVMCLLLRSGFRLVTLPWRPDWWNPAEIVDLLKVLPAPQRNRRVLGYIPDQGTSPSIPQFGWVLVVQQFIHLRMMKATVFLGTFTAAEMICASTQSSLWALWTIPLTLWLGFCSATHCQLWDHIYTGVCLSKSCPINWIKQLDSNQFVETPQGWSMETGYTWAQFRVS
jgi:hypothetical protein